MEKERLECGRVWNRIAEVKGGVWRDGWDENEEGTGGARIGSGRIGGEGKGRGQPGFEDFPPQHDRRHLAPSAPSPPPPYPLSTVLTLRTHSLTAATFCCFATTGEESSVLSGDTSRPSPRRKRRRSLSDCRSFRSAQQYVQ